MLSIDLYMWFVFGLIFVSVVLFSLDKIPIEITSLAIISIISTSIEVNPIGLFIPFLLLIIPLLDMLVVIIRRLINRESPFLSDRSHLHHKLIDSGFSELGTVIFIYSLSQWIAILTIGLASTNDGLYLLATMLSSVLLFFGFILSKYIL